MAYPPSVPTGARINTTPQVNLHPSDHLAIHASLTDIINEMGANPSGAFASIDARLTADSPIGVPMMWLTGAPPSGHSLLNGTAISRVGNPVLFALWASTYGSGDGSTTFNLPDLRNKFPVGAGTTGFTATLNVAGGNKDAVAVSHGHTASSGLQNTNHGHEISAGTSTNGSHGHSASVDGTWMAGATANPSGTMAAPSYPGVDSRSTPNVTVVANGGHSHSVTGTTGNQNASHDHTVTVNADGVTGTNANLPPFFPVNWIVRLG